MFEKLTSEKECRSDKLPILQNDSKWWYLPKKEKKEKEEETITIDMENLDVSDDDEEEDEEEVTVEPVTTEDNADEEGTRVKHFKDVTRIVFWLCVLFWETDRPHFHQNHTETSSIIN